MELREIKQLSLMYACRAKKALVTGGAWAWAKPSRENWQAKAQKCWLPTSTRKIVHGSSSSWRTTGAQAELSLRTSPNAPTGTAFAVVAWRNSAGWTTAQAWHTKCSHPWQSSRYPLIWSSQSTWNQSSTQRRLSSAWLSYPCYVVWLEDRRVRIPRREITFTQE